MSEPDKAEVVVGSVRLCNPERDKDKPFGEVTDFEVWTGEVWVHAQDHYNRLWAAQGRAR